MKRLITLTFVALLVTTTANRVSAQTSVGLRAGLDIARLGPEVDTDSKTGLLFGVFVGRDFGERLGIQVELDYSQKGAVTEFLILDVGGGEATVGDQVIRLDYIELQVPIVYIIPMENKKVKPRIYAGPTLAFEVSCETEFEEPSGNSVAFGCEDEIDVGFGPEPAFTRTKTLDFGIVLGVGVELGEGAGVFTADIRLDTGLTNINEFSPPLIKNRALQLLIGYLRRI